MYENLLKKVLSKIKPSKKQLAEEKEFISRLVEKIESIRGKHVGVVIAGSVARNTHLKDNRDIDVFLLFPTKLSDEEFRREGLRIAKKVFGKNQYELAYAQHPYVRGVIEGFNVEIVPSFKISDTTQIRSAVDRTPFHNEYLLKKLTPQQKDEVRLLKQFLRGIKCYGAELKMSSFSGYLAELLIVHYGSFLETLSNAANWKKPTIIDIEGYYENADIIAKRFKEHFVVIDPTDSRRNVASAVSYNQFARFIAASRQFLKKPSLKFFFGERQKTMEYRKVKKSLTEKELVALKFEYPPGLVAEVVWGQLKRLCKILSQTLTKNEFRIFRIEPFTDEKNICMLLIDLENRTLQKVHKLFGPEIVMKEHCERFLQKHKKCYAGPRIEEGRLVVEEFRKYWKVEDLIDATIKKLRKEKGTKKPMKSLLRSAGILNESAILKLYK
ncbi:MAG: CCA tRNA nucleotidyltransferase, partial [Candidatus Iainarchaeum archaeon]